MQIRGEADRASDGLAKREAKSMNWPDTMLETVLSGIGRNPGPTTNEAGCIRPEGKNVPGAGRPADGGVFSSCWCDDVSPATPAREDSNKVAGIAAAAAVRGGMNP